MIVYTACNAAYIPGVIALHNSFRQTNEGRFVVLYDGDDPSELTRRGIEVIIRPSIDLPVIPQTLNRPDETAEVHCFRFAIPELTEGDRAIYIDADALVMKNLQPLWELEFEEPIAATLSNGPLRKEISGRGVPDTTGFISSLLIFNIPAWNEQRVLEKCQHIVANSDLKFNTGDQALLNWALLGNWHHLPISYQAHVGRLQSYSFPPDEIYVKHFLGTNPWDEIPEHLQPYDDLKLKARAIWREYFELADSA